MRIKNANTMPFEETKLINKQEMIMIYEQHSPELFRFAVRLLDDEELAEDCVSETFSRFLQVMRRGRGPLENVRAYLYRVAQNWINDHFRRRPHPQLALDEEFEDGASSNPSLMASQEMDKELVRTALLKLPEDQQKVIHLRFLEDWSHAAIAELLGKSVVATRALQYRALISLRQMLTERDDGVYYE